MVGVRHGRVVVHFDKRSHNPVLREAALDRDYPPIPWLGNLFKHQTVNTSNQELIFFITPRIVQA